MEQQDSDRYTMKCTESSPMPARCIEISMKEGLTSMSPRELIMTRCPGRLNNAKNLPARATMSCWGSADEFR